MITVTEVTTKNGKQYQVCTWQIDTSKPKIWVEGNFYKFNLKLLWSEYRK